jgi:antirestriction protein ArdC
MTNRQIGERPASADRLSAAHEHLVRAVEDLTTSEAWRRMLEVAARFPTYSANNILLIGVQRPDATRVAGIRTWNSLGRRVRKGEKGIAILAPCLYRAKPEPADAGAVRDPEAQTARQLRGFRVVHVFDLAQTDGRPLPEVGPAELTGTAPGDLVQRLATVIATDGYAVERGDCGQAYGYTDFATRTVRVRDSVADAQAAKTFAHELAHIRADHGTRFLGRYATSIGCRAQAEVEAESISYLIASAAGMPTDGYAVPYVAGWSGGNLDLVRDAATRVVTTAREAIRDLGLMPDPASVESSSAGIAPVAPAIGLEPPHDPLSA